MHKTIFTARPSALSITSVANIDHQTVYTHNGPMLNKFHSHRFIYAIGHLLFLEYKCHGVVCVCVCTVWKRWHKNPLLPFNVKLAYRYVLCIEIGLQSWKQQAKKNNKQTNIHRHSNTRKDHVYTNGCFNFNLNLSNRSLHIYVSRCASSFSLALFNCFFYFHTSSKKNGEDLINICVHLRG